MSAALLLDLAFVAANSLKIPHGGWLPLAAGSVCMLVMFTWQSGRLLMLDRTSRHRMPMRDLIEVAGRLDTPRVDGTAVYLTGSPEAVPRALQRMLETQRVLHRRVVLMTVETVDEPRTRKGHRVELRQLASGLYRLRARCGFMETLTVPSLLREAERAGLPFLPAETLYFVGRNQVVVTRAAGMPAWQKRLYAFMARNADFPAEHYGLPPARVTEIGEQIDI
jgi:KUP system potassium uptake protein